MARTYQSMGYREIQKYNSSLLQEYQDLNQERKAQGLQNRGWGQVIKLYEWLNTRVGKVATLLKSFFLMEQSASEFREAVSESQQTVEKPSPKIEECQDEIKHQPNPLVLQYIPKNNIVEMKVYQ